jgi:RNA polymerase sigma-70 factor (ECF subfamily)
MAEPSAGTFEGHTVARRLVAGDETVLGELYDQHSAFVHGLALRVIGDRTAAEDVTQDVFVQLWQQPERYDPARGSIRTLLGTMTHRRAVDHIRREQARRDREHKVAREPTSAAVAPALDDGLVHGATIAAVHEAISSLPRPQREALELAYFRGHTYREVATVLGIPEGTAKSRLRLALARIADRVHTEMSEQSA